MVNPMMKLILHKHLERQTLLFIPIISFTSGVTDFFFLPHVRFQISKSKGKGQEKYTTPSLKFFSIGICMDASIFALILIIIMNMNCTQQFSAILTC